VPFGETDDIQRPMSPYAATKRAGELHAGPTTTCTASRRPACASSPSTARASGPRWRSRSSCAPAREEARSRSSATARRARDYTYIDDIVDGVVRALDRCAGYEIYNLGESATTSLSELVGWCGEACGAAPILDRQPMQPGDVLVTYADVSKAREAARLRARDAVREGLARYVAWYKARRALSRCVEGPRAAHRLRAFLVLIRCPRPRARSRVPPSLACPAPRPARSSRMKGVILAGVSARGSSR
jgi:UDP-glucuronate 4-epimerase